MEGFKVEFVDENTGQPTPHWDEASNIAYNDNTVPKLNTDNVQDAIGKLAIRQVSGNSVNGVYDIVSHVYVENGASYDYSSISAICDELKDGNIPWQGSIRHYLIGVFDSVQAFTNEEPYSNNDPRHWTYSIMYDLNHGDNWADYNYVRFKTNIYDTNAKLTKTGANYGTGWTNLLTWLDSSEEIERVTDDVVKVITFNELRTLLNSKYVYACYREYNIHNRFWSDYSEPVAITTNNIDSFVEETQEYSLNSWKEANLGIQCGLTTLSNKVYKTITYVQNSQAVYDDYKNKALLVTRYINSAIAEGISLGASTIVFPRDKVITLGVEEDFSANYYVKNNVNYLKATFNNTTYDYKLNYQGTTAIVLPSNVTIDLNGCTLQAGINYWKSYALLRTRYNTSNVIVKNGKLYGDNQYEHHVILPDSDGASHEWNTCIGMCGNNITLVNVECAYIRGDVLSIFSENSSTVSCDNKNSSSRKLEKGAYDTATGDPIDGVVSNKNYNRYIRSNQNNKIDVGSAIANIDTSVKYEVRFTPKQPLQSIAYDSTYTEDTRIKLYNLYLGLAATILYYDENNNYISYESGVQLGAELTVPANTKYISFFIKADNNASVDDYYNLVTEPVLFDILVTSVSTSVTVQNCDIHDAGRNGVSLSLAKYFVLKDSFIHDVTGNSSNFVGLDFEGYYDSSHVDRDTLIENVKIRRCYTTNSIGTRLSGGNIAIPHGNHIVFRNCDFQGFGCTANDIKVYDSVIRGNLSFTSYTHGNIATANQSVVKNTAIFGSCKVYNTIVENCYIQGAAYSDTRDNDIFRTSVAATKSNYIYDSYTASAKLTRGGLSCNRKGRFINCRIEGGIGTGYFYGCNIFDINKGTEGSLFLLEARCNDVIDIVNCNVELDSLCGAYGTSGSSRSSIAYPILNIYNSFVRLVRDNDSNSNIRRLFFNKIIGNTFITNAIVSSGAIKVKLTPTTVIKDNVFKTERTNAVLSNCLALDITGIDGNIVIDNNIIYCNNTYLQNVDYSSLIKINSLEQPVLQNISITNNKLLYISDDDGVTVAKNKINSDYVTTIVGENTSSGDTFEDDTIISYGASVQEVINNTGYTIDIQ